MRRSRALSPQALGVVAALASADEWRHGYELMTQAGVKSGTLYPLLMRLEAQGLLEARWVESPQTGRPPRHVYKLTPAGRDWFSSQTDARAAIRTQPTSLHPAKARS